MAAHMKVQAEPGRIINANVQPVAHNPHSWLELSGGGICPGVKLLTGTLRSRYRDFDVTAAAFGRAKLQPMGPIEGHPWVITTHRAEVLLPSGADDRFLDPQTLLEAADELATGPDDPLLGYITFDWWADRLHEQLEEVRAFARAEIVSLGCPVLMVHHAPHLARSYAEPHLHLLVVPHRLRSLGWCEPIKKVVNGKTRSWITERFIASRAAAS